MQLDERRLAVGGVDEQPVGQHLDPLADPEHVADALLVAPAPNRISSTSRVEYSAISDRGEPSATILPGP